MGASIVCASFGSIVGFGTALLFKVIAVNFICFSLQVSPQKLKICEPPQNSLSRDG
jgi:hypothetical protein